MPWHADGTFSRLYSWAADAAAGLDIMSSRMDGDTNDIVQGVERTRNLDGYNTPTVNLPMGGFKHTGVGPGVAATDYARFDQVVPATGGSFTGAVNFTSINASGQIVAGSFGALNCVQGLSVSGTYPGQSWVLGVTGGIVGTGDAVLGGGLTAATGNFGGGAVTIGGGGINTNNLTVTNHTDFQQWVTVDQGLAVSGLYPSTSYALWVNGDIHAGNAVLTGGLTASTGNFGGGAVTLGAGGLTASTGNFGGGAVTIGGGGLTVNSLSVNTNATINGPLYMDNQIIAPSGGGGLPMRNGVVLYADAGTGAAVALSCNGSIGVVAYAGGDGRVDAAGGFYRSGVPHLMADPAFGALFRALDEAPDGTAMIVVKQAGQLTARPVSLMPADELGRRNLYLEEAA